MIGRNCVAKKTNLYGVTLALVADSDGTFRVLKLHESFDARVAGNVRRSWRYVKRKLSRRAADELYYRTDIK